MKPMRTARPMPRPREREWEGCEWDAEEDWVGEMGGEVVGAGGGWDWVVGVDVG